MIIVCIFNICMYIHQVNEIVLVEIRYEVRAQVGWREWGHRVARWGLHSDKKVPEIDHSKSPLREIVKNLSDAKFERDLSFSLLTELNVFSSSQVCSAILPMDKNIEQWICAEFCIANEISCEKSLKILQKAYGGSALSKTRAYEWSVYSKAVEMWRKIRLALVGHQGLQLKLKSLNTIPQNYDVFSFMRRLREIIQNKN